MYYHLIIRPIGMSDPWNGYCNHIEYRDRSLAHEDHYTIYCALWAGPEHELALNEYNILEDTYAFDGMIRSGVGGFSIIEEDKLKNDSLILVPKAVLH